MNDKETSFQNFAEDVWVRSLECRDWIRRFNPKGLSSRWNSEQLADFRELYDQIEKSLLSQSKLVDAGGSHAVENVFFHQKYGWVPASARAKAYLGKVSMPDATPLEIGKQTYLSGHSTLRGRHPLVIGQFTAIAEGLYLNTSPDLHPTEYPAMINFASEVRCRDEGLNMDIVYEQIREQPTGIEIGSDVWIGRNVRIAHGARIPHGCVIAEKSLVRGTLEPYGIYAGTSAKLKRLRFDESVVAALLKLQWWNWSSERILRNKAFFAANLKNFRGDILSLVEE